MNHLALGWCYCGSFSETSIMTPSVRWLSNWTHNPLLSGYVPNHGFNLVQTLQRIHRPGRLESQI